YDMPHFTERCRSGSVRAASASTASAMPRCGCGRLAMYAKTGWSPTAAFAGLARPVMASGSVVATPTGADVRETAGRTASLPWGLEFMITPVSRRWGRSTCRRERRGGFIGSKPAGSGRLGELAAPRDVRVGARGQVEAARSALAVVQLVDAHLDPPPSGVRVLRRTQPAHPLPPRHRRDVVPDLLDLAGRR